MQSGVKENQFKEIAKTGLIVDIFGKAEKTEQEFLIAFRADMDALATFEGN